MCRKAECVMCVGDLVCGGAWVGGRCGLWVGAGVGVLGRGGAVGGCAGVNGWVRERVCRRVGMCDVRA